jgi:heme oxygenase
MRRLFDDSYTISEYRVHLGRLLGFFEPLECAVDGAADLTIAVYALQRSRALREDLHIMGMTKREIDALERCSDLPLISLAGLHGYTYVILGSMLGGKIIVNQLRKVLGPEASFRFYGDGNGLPEALWASYCSALEEEGQDDVEAICGTAVGIFDAYAEWFSEPPLQVGSF